MSGEKLLDSLRERET